MALAESSFLIAFTVFPVAIVRARLHSAVWSKMPGLASARSANARTLPWGGAIVQTCHGFLVQRAAVDTGAPVRFWTFVQAIEPFVTRDAYAFQRLPVAFPVFFAETLAAGAAFVFKFAAFAAISHAANAFSIPAFTTFGAGQRAYGGTTIVPHKTTGTFALPATVEVVR